MSPRKVENNHLKDINNDLLETLKMTVPWLGKLIAEGVHLDCVAPSHAEKTLDRVNAVISMYGETNDDIPD